MTALDALLDSRATHHEIAVWLEISEQAVAMRHAERQRQSAPNAWGITSPLTASQVTVNVNEMLSNGGAWLPNSLSQIESLFGRF